MNLNDFKLLKEADDCYVVGHPNGKSLMIQKSGLNDKAQKIIEKWKSVKNYSGEDGSEVVADAPEISQAPAPDLTNVPSALLKNEDLPQGPVTPMAPQGPVQIGNSDVKSAAPGEINADNPQGMMAAKSGTVEQALQSQKEALGKEASAQAGQAGSESAALKATQQLIDKMPTQQDIMNQYKVKDDALMKSFQDAKVDPMRFYKDMSAGSKIAAGIAMVLGGIGSGLTGQPNAAAASLKDLVDKDVDAQKNDQSKAMNAWKMNREALGNDMAANLATQNQLYTGLKYKLMQAASSAQGPIALARAQGGMALLDQQMAQNRFQLSLIQQGMGTNTQGKYSGQDPSILVPQLVKDPGAQKVVFDEIERAQNTKHSRGAIMDAFDNASKDVRPMSGGAVKNMVPGITSPYVKAFHAEMGPTFGKLEGTVRQTAMDNMDQNLTPQFGDSDKTIEIKRKALENYLNSAQSAPTAKGHGIDLSKFQSTAVEPSSANPVVNKFMSNNPGLTEDQAIQILKKHGKM